MIEVSSSSTESQINRLLEKTPEQQMINRVIDGTGISPWEARVLVEEVKKVYIPGMQFQLAGGQMLYTCVASSEGAGKPINECRMVTVALTLISQEDRPVFGEPGYGNGIAQQRSKKILRITEEARDQGGLLSQEDLSQILCCDVRTIRRDIMELKKAGTIVATRGTIKDIGPGVTHRELAIRHWLDGKEVVDVARAINHSVAAVERYIHDFSRTVYLRRKDFAPLQIAMTIGRSAESVNIFLAIYEKYRNSKNFISRFEYIDLVGGVYYESVDEKKTPSSPKTDSKKIWRRP